MLFSQKTNASMAQTADTGKIRLGGACRLPLSGDRDINRTLPTRNLPGETARHGPSTRDTGKIRLGGACRLPLANG